MKPSAFIILFFIATNAKAQNVGIGTTSPQATLDVKGNHRVGGLSKYITFDSTSGKIIWNNANLFVPSPQYLMQHSASAEGLYYGNNKLLYRGINDTAFFTDWQNGNGYFKGNVGIGKTNPGAKLHVISGASGYNDAYFPGIVLEGSGNTYLNIITPDDNESSVLFGKASNAASGGIIYNNISNPNGLQFRTNGNIDRMVINSSGKVGIGMPIPSEKLEVSGNIKASSFQYTTPKALYYSIPDAAFSSTNSGYLVFKSGGNGGAYILNAPGLGQLVAPLHLPHGAELVSLTFDFYDASASQDISGRMILQHASGFTVYAGIQSSGSGGVNSQTITYNPTIPINNQLYAYIISVSATTGAWNTADLQIRRVMVEYTLTETQ